MCNSWQQLTFIRRMEVVFNCWSIGLVGVSLWWVFAVWIWGCLGVSLFKKYLIWLKRVLIRFHLIPSFASHVFYIFCSILYIISCRVVVHCARTGTYTILPPLYIHCCLQCKHLGLAMRNLVPQSSSTNASTIGNQKRVSKEQWLSAAP